MFDRCSLQLCNFCFQLFNFFNVFLSFIIQKSSFLGTVPPVFCPTPFNTQNKSTNFEKLCQFSEKTCSLCILYLKTDNLLLGVPLGNLSSRWKNVQFYEEQKQGIVLCWWDLKLWTFLCFADSKSVVFCPSPRRI